MPFLNPFHMHARDRVEQNVVIPLSEARRHSSSSSDDGEKAGARGDGDVWTIEALRAEIEADAVVSGENPVYDRELSPPGLRWYSTLLSDG
jgi:hypothetical protein